MASTVKTIKKQVNKPVVEDHWSLLRMVVLGLGIYLFPSLISSTAGHIGMPLLTTRPVAGGLGMLLAVFAAYLVPPVRRLSNPIGFKYLIVAASASLIYFAYNSFFRDEKGNYVGLVPEQVTIFLSTALLILVLLITLRHEPKIRRRLVWCLLIGLAVTLASTVLEFL